jgi:hypothetical protein
LLVKYTLAAVAAIGLTPSLALAQPTPQEKVIAQTLFDDGRAKMNAGDYAAACPKLAESYRLDPAPGTLLNLGMCHEAEGRLATAYAELGEALSRAIRDGRSDRQKTAREHLAAITLKLSKLQLRVDPAAPKDLKIEVDGIVLARAAWDVAVPMDPGEHVVVANATGRLPTQTRVTVEADGSTKELVIGDLPIDPAAGKHTVVLPPVVEPPKPPPAPAETTPSPLRIAGFVALGVGGASLITGAIFGGLAAGQWSSAESQCPGRVCTTDEGMATGRRAGTLADVATITLIVGGVLAAGGLALVLVAPKAKSAAWISPSLGGVVVGGTF